MTARPQTSRPDTGARRRRPADRRRMIVDAAAKAFSDGGYHAVRLDDIADAAYWAYRERFLYDKGGDAK